VLKQYALFLKDIRAFFDKRDILEVVTPSLSPYAIPDVYIDSLTTTINTNINNQETQYFHTSPEIEMKKLLCQGHKNIYQIAKVFRDNEQGEINFNEFTMLEWYRRLTVSELVTEVREFVAKILKIKDIPIISYQTVFKQYTNIDNIYTQTLEELKAFARANKLSDDFDDLSDMQMFLFVHFVEANLDTIIIIDYPKEQAGLSVVKDKVALRFELYIKGIEVANGAQELWAKSDYKQAFQNDINKRKKLNKFTPNLDDSFLEILNDKSSEILSHTSGVAIGLDRLFMLKCREIL
jgi:lysyl-tRNA synthetase class 2